MNARGKFRYGVLLASTLLCATPGFAADNSEAVETRISRLEQELAELKALVKSKPVATTTADIPAAPVKKAEAPASVSTGSGAKVQLYGFARFDASYDSGQISPGNIALWAQPKIGNSSNDSEWNLTGGATRLGLNLSGPDTESIKLTGNIEFDFLSSNSTSENNQLPRLRHGYLKAYWPASDFSIVAGQTWDLVSSLIPFVDDPAIMWGAGNIGSRHAQLRLTKGFSAGEKSRIELAAAASRTIGEKNTINDISATDTGKDAAMPTIQGRVAWSGPLLVASQPATLAVSGHFGEEEWDSNNTGAHKTIDSWSCNAEVSMPLSQKLALAGEYFTGSNLDDYWGGIGQGVNSSNKIDPKGIRSHGGWGALRLSVNPETSFSIGAGLDDPKDGDLATGTKSRNQTIFANVINKVTPSFIIGLQLGEWRTNYKGAGESDALRAQTSLTYKF